MVSEKRKEHKAITSGMITRPATLKSLTYYSECVFHSRCVRGWLEHVLDQREICEKCYRLLRWKSAWARGVKCYLFANFRWKIAWNTDWLQSRSIMIFNFQSSLVISIIHTVCSNWVSSWRELHIDRNCLSIQLIQIFIVTLLQSHTGWLFLNLFRKTIVECCAPFNYMITECGVCVYHWHFAFKCQFSALNFCNIFEITFKLTRLLLHFFPHHQLKFRIQNELKCA